MSIVGWIVGIAYFAAWYWALERLGAWRWLEMAGEHAGERLAEWIIARL